MNHLKLILSMIIFGTIGLVRRYIPYSSALTAFSRGVIGTLFLLAVYAVQKKKPDYKAIRKNIIPLFLSGALLGLNWIALFEAYRYTSVSIATVSYYMESVIVILLSPVLLHEKLTKWKTGCAFVSLLGMVLISGAGQSDLYGMKGILLGLLAACMYAAIVLINRIIKGTEAMDRTIVQLGVSAAVLLPYIAVTENVSLLSFDLQGMVMLVVAGVVHTGIAYAMYFDSVRYVAAQSTAILSYLDPVVAVVLSALVLKEALTPAIAAGIVMILAGALCCEMKSTS